MKPTRRIILRKHREEADSSPRSLSFLKGLGLTLIALFIAAFAGAGIRYALFSQSLPSLDLFRLHYESGPSPTSFYARDGETLLFTLAYDDFESHDLHIHPEEGESGFPETFLKADRYTREAGIAAGTRLSMTEEMVRNVYADYLAGSSRPDFAARLLSLQIRKAYGDEQIAEWYYNTAWFGQMAFGLDAASRLYLDKSGGSLNDAECVLMSAIINAPMLNPIDSKGALRDFYLDQLDMLRRAGLFDEETAESLSRHNFIIFEAPRYAEGREPDVITQKALDAAMLYYGREQVERGGLRVVTSEDPSLQSYLRCVTSEENNGEDSPCPLSSVFSDDERQTAAEILRTAPASISVIEVGSGQILAELEAQPDSENRRIYKASLQAYPIGTSINFFAALTAFSGGSAPSSLLWDLENADLSYQADGEEEWYGPVSLRQVLTADYQRPLAAHLQRFGSGAVQRNAAMFGLSNSQMLTDRDVLSIGGSYTAENLAYALLPFASLGKQTGADVGGALHPVSILRIERESGAVEYPQAAAEKSLIAGNLAYLVHDVFSQDSGTLSLADRPAAVKVGSVPGDSSRWISGYSTELSCVLRLADPKTISAFVVNNDRVAFTAEILWRSVMEAAHKDRPVRGWEVPADISQVRVCLPSGKLPTAACGETVTEIFLQGNEPYEYDEYYVAVPINRGNRLLATSFTPAEDVVNEVFLNLPADAAEWAAENGIEQMPDAYDPIRSNTKTAGIQIDSPAEFQYIASGDKMDIIIRLNLRQKPDSVQVSLGKGMYPTLWQEICKGENLENGQWLLCSPDTSEFEQGLYVLRVSAILPDDLYQSAETYFTVQSGR
ncbi:MAG: transglycosylase domain-containing protein [Anaerolineaceae bacterium]|nr:transglycosylase domain-containing protein [Anaerolineaceae bacterium]